jgi:hypothetical protein
MKTLFSILAVVGLTMLGCSDQSELTNPPEGAAGSLPKNHATATIQSRSGGTFDVDQTIFSAELAASYQVVGTIDFSYDYNPFTSDFVFSTQADLVYKPVNLDVSYALSEQRAQHVSGEPVIISDDFDLDALPRSARIHVDYEIDDGIQMIGITILAKGLDKQG